MLQHSLKHIIEDANKRKASLFIPVDLLSKEECRSIIARYQAAIEKNFHYWLSAALIAVQTEPSRHITQENLRIEIQDNHCQMLKEFAISARAKPDTSDFNAVSKAVKKIDKIVTQLSGFQCMALITIFESETFSYPYLKELAVKSNASSFKYIEVHMLEDPHHAYECYKALFTEATITRGNMEIQLSAVINAVDDLYHSIFQLPTNF